MRRAAWKAALVFALAGGMGCATTKPAAQEDGAAKSTAAKSIPCSCGGKVDAAGEEKHVHAGEAHQPAPADGQKGTHADGEHAEHAGGHHRAPAAGHGAAKHPSAGASPEGLSAISTAQELAPELVGQLEDCLVTTERFKVEAATPAVRYEGKVYVFCCTGCAEEFLADPASFLPSGA